VEVFAIFGADWFGSLPVKEGHRYIHTYKQAVCKYRRKMFYHISMLIVTHQSLYQQG